MVRIKLIEPQTGYLDVKEGTSFPLTYSVADVRDLSSKQSTFSKTIVLEGTENNNKLLSFIFDINTTDGTFNINTLQKVDVIQNETVILQDAYLQLTSVNNLNGALEYNATVFESKVSLFDALGQKELTDLDFSDLDHNLNTTNIVASFSNTQSKYKYILPYTDRNEFSISECKPAIFTKEYLDRMFAVAGFTYSITDPTTRGRINNTLIPYNGEQFTVNQTLLNENTVIATQASRSNTRTSTNGRLNTTAAGVEVDLIAGTEVQDDLGIYDNTNGEYEAQLSVPNDKGHYEVIVKATYTQKFVNSTGATAYLVPVGTRDNVVNTIGIGTRLNGTTKNFAVAHSVTTVTTNSIVYSIPNGTTTAGAAKTVTLNLFTTSVNVNDIIKEFYRVNSTQSNSTWRATNSASGTIVNIDTVWEITNITLTIKPHINSVGFDYPLTANDFIPKKIKQSDFLKSILTMFNMVAIVDPTNDRNIIFETRDRYYDNGTRKDWTSKLDTSKEQVITFLPELSNKRYVLTYKQDTDPANSVFLQATSEIYGQLEFEFDSEYVKDKTTKEVIFSPTPIGYVSLLDAYLPLINGYDPKNNIRILNDCGNKNCNTYSIYDYGTTGVSRTSYPLVHHFDNALIPNFDLNFGTCDYYFYQPTTLTNNTLFNLYWRRTFNQLNKGKMFTAYFKLNEADIYAMKLSDTIQVGNALYNINKIYDYDANNNELTKVELITIDDGFSVVKQSRKNITTKPNATLSKNKVATSQLIQDIQLSANIIDSDSAIVKGRGNVVSGDNVMVIGNSNVVNGSNTSVQGDSNIVAADGVQVLANDTTTSETTTLPYTEYVAILTQSGTDAPEATVLYNNTGLDITYSYLSVGAYVVELNDVSLLSGDVYVTLDNGFVSSICYLDKLTGDDTIEIRTKDETFTLTNGLLINATLTIRIYN
jgi:hypothetical protein